MVIFSVSVPRSSLVTAFFSKSSYSIRNLLKWCDKMHGLLTLEINWHFGKEQYDIIGGTTERFLSWVLNQNTEAVHWGGMIEADDTSADESLIKAVLSGDDEAFAELIRRHKRKIFSIVAKFARDDDELDDVSQEIFVKVYQGLNKYRGDAPFEHWLSKLAVNASMTCSGKGSGMPVKSRLSLLNFH